MSRDLFALRFTTFGFELDFEPLLEPPSRKFFLNIKFIFKYEILICTLGLNFFSSIYSLIPRHFRLDFLLYNFSVSFLSHIPVLNVTSLHTQLTKTVFQLFLSGRVGERGEREKRVAEDDRSLYSTVRISISDG